MNARRLVVIAAGMIGAAALRWPWLILFSRTGDGLYLWLGRRDDAARSTVLG
jgi:hypothetical protein